MNRNPLLYGIRKVFPQNSYRSIVIQSKYLDNEMSFYNDLVNDTLWHKFVVFYSDENRYEYLYKNGWGG